MAITNSSSTSPKATPLRFSGEADMSIMRDLLKRSPLDDKAGCSTNNLVSLTIPRTSMVPSRYNARALHPDGRLIIWNTLSGAISVFGAAQRPAVEKLLSRREKTTDSGGKLGNYMLERGFIVREGENEYRQFVSAFGNQHYKTDELELILMSSEDCNFRCKYCYEDFPRGTMTPATRQGIARYVRARGHQLKGLNVSWFGGEPLYGFAAIEELAPFFKDFSSSNGIDFASTMTTNGYLLDNETAGKLISWGITRFQITIDGDADQHNVNRPTRDGGNSHEMILQNLRALRARSEDFFVRIRVNFDPSNHPHLFTFLDSLALDFAGDSRFGVAFYKVGRWGGKNDDQLDVCGRHESHAIKASLHKKAVANKLVTDTLKNHNELGMGVCYAARPYNLLIGANGAVMKCTVALDKMPDNIVGQIHEDGTLSLNNDRMSLWTSPAFQEDSGCQKCHMVPSCQGMSCPLLRFEEKRSPCDATAKHNMHNELVGVADAHVTRSRRITL